MNSKELFNLRHAQLRTTVEQVLGLYKRKWRIIRYSAPEYSFIDQIQIVYAVTGLHNFVQTGGVIPETKRREEQQALLQWKLRGLADARERADAVVAGRTGLQLRDAIAAWTWEFYREGREGDDDDNNNDGDDNDDNDEGADDDGSDLGDVEA